MSIIILEGSRIDNTLIKEKGYQFQFDQLNQAAADLL
jgi:NAD dependent epimerase/dehydratase family enzyme